VYTVLAVKYEEMRKHRKNDQMGIKNDMDIKELDMLL